MKVKKGDCVTWIERWGKLAGPSPVHHVHRDGTVTVTAPHEIGAPLLSVNLKDVVTVIRDGNSVQLRRQIGRKYGDELMHGAVTYLHGRLEGTFRLMGHPGLEFRVHPTCDGLICADGEIVVQSNNGPNGSWLDFCREQQDRVLDCVK